MKLSTYEQKALDKSAIKSKKYRRTGIKREIKNYPGRIVTVDQAYDRIKKNRQELHDACTLPIQSNKQRNKPTIDASAPGLIADLESKMSVNAISKKWGVAWRTIKDARDRHYGKIGE